MKKISDVFKSIRFAKKQQHDPKHVKMAVGIASDPRHKGGDYSGAHAKIEKIAKGLASHPQVAAVLKKQNEAIDEGMSGGSYASFHKETGKIGYIGNKTGMIKHVKSNPDHARGYTGPDRKVGDIFGGYPKKTVKEEVEQLEEGRPSQRHPLEGHEYHKKSDEALIHIAKDAHAAAEAMKSHNTTAENKYRDQANDSATVRYFRKKNGMPEWYKKKYGHIKEAKDEREYGYEGDMAISQLKTIMRHAEHMMGMLKEDTDLPEWVQSKITLATDYMQTAHDYMMSELDEVVKTDVSTDVKNLDAVSFIKKHGVNKNKAKMLAQESEHKEPKKVDDKKPPFEGPYKKKPSATPGKYGPGYSTAKHLAKQGMKKVMGEKIQTELSSKAKIVKKAAKKEQFNTDPEISSSVTRNL